MNKVLKNKIEQELAYIDLMSFEMVLLKTKKAREKKWFKILSAIEEIKTLTNIQPRLQTVPLK